MNTRSLPPAGHPIPIKVFFQSFLKKGTKQDFLQEWFPDRQVFWVSSGTAALTLSLKAISGNSSRKKVILPAYSCPSVLASVIKAGLQPVLCDMAPNSFQMDLDQLKRKIDFDTLAVIAVHLFGIPENMSDLGELTKKEGVILIEDAAQAFGNGHLGSFGDIGILSFGRGKPLTLLGGGAVLVNNIEFKEAIVQEYGLLPQKTGPSFLGYLLSLLVYSKFFHPNLYWVPQRLPWLKLGETIFTMDFEIRRLNCFVLKIGSMMISGFDNIAKIRMDLATVYAERLGRLKPEFIFFPKIDDDATYLLRFPLVLRKTEKRDIILNTLREKGLGATGMYPVPLNEQQGIPNGLFGGESYPNAKQISKGILTLPLHEHVRIEDINLICQTIENHLLKGRGENQFC